MAPEQFSGLDERSNLFAFCVVLWEALYGARPFTGENIMGLGYAITQGAVQEGPRGRAVPRGLRRVLFRGLAASPEARWPVAGSSAGDLRRSKNQRNTKKKRNQSEKKRRSK